MTLLQTFLHLNPGAAVLKNGDCSIVFCEPSQKSLDFLLAHNTGNRPIRQLPSDAIQSDMEEGRFYITAQGIGMSDDIVLDGQHRLLAASRSAVKPKMIFVFGLDPKSQAVVDQHAKRSVADAIKMFVNPEISARMVSTARMIIAVAGLSKKGVPFMIESSVPSIQQIADTVAEWEPELVIASRFSFSAPVVSAIVSFARLFDFEKAVEFSDLLKTGANLDRNSPVLRLRNYIADNKINGNTSRLKLLQISASALKLFDVGREIQLLKGSASW